MSNAGVEGSQYLVHRLASLYGFETYSDLARARVCRRSLIHLIQETDELVLGDPASDLTGLRHANEQVGDLSCLLRLDESDP